MKLKLDLDILEGPHECCICSCGEDIEFKVYGADGATEIGKISKQWAGFFNEAFTDYDIFGINFPKDLEVTKKALLLGATFLIGSLLHWGFQLMEKILKVEEDVEFIPVLVEQTKCQLLVISECPSDLTDIKTHPWHLQKFLAEI